MPSVLLTAMALVQKHGKHKAGAQSSVVVQDRAFNRIKARQYVQRDATPYDGSINIDLLIQFCFITVHRSS